MAKFTQDGCNVEFIVTLRNPFDPCNVLFDLIRDISNNVVISDSVISVISDQHTVFDKSPVVTSDSIILVSSDGLTLFSTNAIQAEDSVVKITSDTSTIESYDSDGIGVKTSSIVISSGVSEIEQITAYSIIIEDSVIKLVSDSISFQNFSGIDIEDSIVKIISDESSLWAAPSVITNDSIIKILSENSPIKLWPSVITSESNILIAGYSSVKNPSPSDLPTAINTSVAGGDGGSISWNAIVPEVDISYVFPWNETTEIRKIEQFIYSTVEEADVSYSIDWKQIPELRTVTQMWWGDYVLHQDLKTTMPWRVFEVQNPEDLTECHSFQIHYSFPWQRAKEYSTEIDIPWYYPDYKDVTFSIPWGSLTPTDQLYYIKWLYPDYVDVHYEIVWGPVDWTNICCQKYWRPPPCTTLVFNTTEPALKGYCRDIVLSIGPSGYNNNLGIFCPYKHSHSGRRDPFEHLREIEEYILKPKVEYDMINTVTVQVLPLNSDIPPVQVSTININTDKDSYLWSFSLTVMKDDFSENFLDMIKPKVIDDEIVYTDILININQNFWVCRVEGFSESRTFGKDSWSVTGRSPSMELGSPQNQKFTYTYNDPNEAKSSGAQIIEEILKGARLGISDTGWKPVFDRYEQRIVHTGFNPAGVDDWGFVNNTVTWQDVTQIEAIKSLTDSIGAFIITEPNSIGAGLDPQAAAAHHRNLYIRPRYNYPPWHWNVSSRYWGHIWGKDSQGEMLPGNKMISTELAMEVGRNNENNADYNAVMVMGTLDIQGENGVKIGFPVLEVYRSGVGEEFRVYAPDIVDEKLQTTPACFEAGRMALCNTGFWMKHTLKMYSLAYPNSEDKTIPPLCWPGDFVQVQEHNRIGRVEKIWYGDVEAVQVAVAVNNNAVYVTQTLGINEYVG